MTCATATVTVSKMRRIFATHGLPLTLVSDNGPAFIGEEFEKFMQKNGIRHILTAPYHPASNGQAERMVRTFKESMKCLSSGDLETRLHRLLFSYRMTPSTATGKSPAQLLFKRQPRSEFDRMIPGSSKPEVLRKEINSGESKKARTFEEDDPVWVKNFNGGEKWIPGTILKKLGKVNYHVIIDKDKKVHRHVDQLFARVPDLGTTQVGVETNTNDKDNNKGREGTSRTPRARKPPSWTKDFEMTTN